MDNMREKLAELLEENPFIIRPRCDVWQEAADWLLSHGVTVRDNRIENDTVNMVKLDPLETVTPCNGFGEWIPVTDRLPNHGDIVLCNTRYRYEVLQWDGRANRWVNNFMNPKKEYVTHWMPLPTPPKGE